MAGGLFRSGQDGQAHDVLGGQVREQHLALGDIDAALDIGHQVIDAMGGIDSARTTGALTDLRAQLTGHQHIRAVADFRNYAA